MAEQVNGSMTGTVDIVGMMSGAPAVSDYEKLIKKPQINGVELLGNKTFEELGMDKVFTSKQELHELEKNTASKQELEDLQKRLDELIDGNEVAY